MIVILMLIIYSGHQCNILRLIDLKTTDETNRCNILRPLT